VFAITDFVAMAGDFYFFIWKLLRTKNMSSALDTSYIAIGTIRQVRNAEEIKA
jgi:hypothetical protein